MRYGGSTVRNNPGIRYRGKSYTHSKWLDVNCEGNIMVVMTLQKKGTMHPVVRFDKVKKEVVAGEKGLAIWR